MNRKQRQRRARRRICHRRQGTPTQGEWLTEQQVLPLLWRPWYFDRLEEKGGAVWVWSIVQHACELPDPELLVPVAAPWTPDEAGMADRYVAIAERLVGTRVLNKPGKLEVDLLTGAVTKSVPADDATLGFAALLRQLYKPAEEASFDRMRNLLGRSAHEIGLDDSVAATLSAWKRTQKDLLDHHMRALMFRVALEDGYIPAQDERGDRVSGLEEIAPRELINAYLYGDMIHWGEGREQLKRWSATERGAAEMELNMLEDAHALAHFYAAFAAVVRRFIP